MRLAVVSRAIDSKAGEALGGHSGSTLRRDWRSSAHFLKGLGPHASDPGWPKWLPQAPFKATTNNSAYCRDWRSPGPYYLKMSLLLRRRAHFQQRVFLHVFVPFG